MLNYLFYRFTYNALLRFRATIKNLSISLESFVASAHEFIRSNVGDMETSGF